MLIKQMNEIKQKMDSYNIIIYYSGPVTQSIIEKLGMFLKEKIKHESSPTITQKVFHIFIEQVQNIINYSAEEWTIINPDEKVPAGIIIIGTENNGKYFIMCGNLIKKSQKQTLSKHLERIKSSDKETLKKMYKEQLKKDLNIESLEHAGLGFIDIARKASQPLEYAIEDKDNDYAFFSIRVVI